MKSYNYWDALSLSNDDLQTAMYIKYQRQSVICSFSVMKSNRVVLHAFFAFAFLVITSGLTENKWFVPSNTTGRAMQPDFRFMLLMNEIYRGNTYSYVIKNYIINDNNIIIVRESYLTIFFNSSSREVYIKKLTSVQN